MNMEQDFKKKQIEELINKEKQSIGLLVAQQKNAMIAFENKQKAADDLNKADLERDRIEAEMEAKYYTPNVLKQMMLQNAVVQAENKPKAINITQVGTDVHENLDLGGQVITQVFNSFAELEKVMSEKPAQAAIKK